MPSKPAEKKSLPKKISVRHPRSEAKPRKPAARRPLLRDFLGKKELSPPKNRPAAPVENPWRTQNIPTSMLDGHPFSAQPMQDLRALEKIAPPPKDALSAAGGKIAYFSDGKFTGVLENGHWSWLESSSGHWWLWPTPTSAPLLRYQDHWWLAGESSWFVLSNGQWWQYRHFPEWNQAGFMRGDGTKLIYGADGKTVILTAPGSGGVVIDKATGEELSRLSPDELPSLKLKIPARINFSP